MEQHIINEYMINQPIMNIGMIGHVSDGKSTITKALTGTATQKHSQEKQKNITIRIGYANAKILKCDSCKKPECYYSTSSDNCENKCPKCDSNSILMNHVSFVDCPGHNMLLATMLNGTSVMDYTILVESSANQNIPAPQTIEHFNCVKNMNIPIIATVLNKIDLINKEKCKYLISDFKNYLSSNECDCPIIPMSATHSINIDILCMILAHLPKPNRNIDILKMPIIRTFNINKPGTKIEDLEGGVIGGSIISGNINKNDIVNLVPGMIIKENEISYYKPLICKIESINSEKNNLETAISGGLIGIKLDIDPGLTCDDKLTGNIITKNITGIVTNNFEAIIKKCYQLDPKSQYIFNINSNNINGKITSKKGEIIKIQLDNYQYIDDNDIITISQNNNGCINLIGYCIFSKKLKYISIEKIN
jgi:translation initiation factor 2 subunit 3